VVFFPIIKVCFLGILFRLFPSSSVVARLVIRVFFSLSLWAHWGQPFSPLSSFLAKDWTLRSFFMVRIGPSTSPLCLGYSCGLLSTLPLGGRCRLFDDRFARFPLVGEKFSSCPYFFLLPPLHLLRFFRWPAPAEITVVRSFFSLSGARSFLFFFLVWGCFTIFFRCVEFQVLPSRSWLLISIPSSNLNLFFQWRL